jgi:acyl-CoA hydrolase
MNLFYKTSFTVLPKDCNYHIPMIFGGEFFARMDLAAAACVSRLLHDSECDSAVTHKFEGEFLAAAEMGDIVFLNCEVIEIRYKSVTVEVTAYREKRATEGQTLIAKAKFVFVTKKNGEFCKHLLPEYKK